jgi:DNA mismatch repair protein MutS
MRPAFDCPVWLMASTEHEKRWKLMTTTHAAHSASEDATPDNRASEFGSILFADPNQEASGPLTPDFFVDLHLDQIVKAAVAKRDEYDLAGFYSQPLHNPGHVRYRQDVVRDLQDKQVRDAVIVFAGRMKAMRGQMNLVRELRHGLQRQRWFLEAANVYCDAAHEFASGLAEATLRSDGFQTFAHHLNSLLDSADFSAFASDARSVREEIGALEYTVNIKGAHVQVDLYRDETDLSAEVQQTFARFQQGDVKEHRWRFPEFAALNHVEEQILDRVAKLFPEPFARLHSFCETYTHAFDEAVLRFDREVQFYLGYLEFIEPLTKAGLEFCLADHDDGETSITQAGFDLSLAAKLNGQGKTPVVNDFELRAPERILVVTGPNQGGKTTFARMVGQIYYLASLGLPVPASRARLPLPDRIYTHFEREEDLQTLRGKFEDELVRIHDILEHATGSSLLIMNESFGSTTLADGLLVGSEIVRQIIREGALGVFVTFIDELATVGPETVSMMSTVVPDDPAQRTFKIERKPADGLAFAVALASKYRLGYEDLRQRIAA